MYPVLGKRREFALTILSDRGAYPGVRVRTDDALYVATPSLTYTVVPIEEPNEFGFSEVGWAEVGAIRLWGALAFSREERKGFFSVYPLGGTLLLMESLNEDLVQGAAVRAASRMPPQNHRLSVDGKVEQVLRLYDALLNADNVLLRGVNCYLKTHMLWNYMEFRDEMAINLHISLEAGLGTLRKRLSTSVGRQVSYKDVYEFIAKTFSQGEGLVEFWQDRRDDRNMLIHPDSDAGAHVMLPMLADDIYELLDPMVSLYRYILIGENRPRFD